MSRVVVGVPMYRSESFVEAALESLLAQQYDDYLVLAVDDASPDATYELASRYAATDSRIVVEANARRLGMIENWKHVFRRSRELFGAFELYAWASDNDLRHPRWLPALVRELDLSPEAVLAYPRTARAADGWIAPKGVGFETRGVTDPIERLRSAVGSMRAGHMVFGLYRSAALEAVGIVPRVVASDVLLLAHLSLYGTLVQVPEPLWFRRRAHAGGYSKGRQRAALFGGSPPAHAFLPIAISHAGWLGWWLLRAGRPPGLNRREALVAVPAYVGARERRRARGGLARIRKPLRRAEGRARKRYRRELKASRRKMRVVRKRWRRRRVKARLR